MTKLHLVTLLLILLGAIILLKVNGLVSSVTAATQSVLNMAVGDSVLISCLNGRLIRRWDSESTRLTVFCRRSLSSPQPTPTAALRATSTVTPSVTRPTSPDPTSPPSGSDIDLNWHPPQAHGDRPAHEHGDQPPQWLLNSGVRPSFSHKANTPNENMPYWKHTGFKGWAGRFQNVDWYGIFHLDFNPGGHVSRFHSYQMWFRDQSGNISHMHGWLDFGQDNNTGPNLITACGADDSIRPIMNPPIFGCGDIAFESWYARAGQADWMPDFGFNINPNYYLGGDASNPSTWRSTGFVRNLNRRIEFAWYPSRSTVRGEFYTTQFGDIVSGPQAPVCGTTRRYGDRDYTVLCLRQYIAPTLTEISFPGNSQERVFPGADTVQLPN